MRLKIKYFKQSGKSICGPVCLRTVMNYYNKKISEKELLKLCKPVINRGTSHKKMLEVARKKGFICRERNKGIVKELIGYIDLGYPVIVNYLNPKSKKGHYSIVKGYDKKNKTLIFSDPSNGDDYRLKWNLFNKIWNNKKNTSKKWFLIISNKKIKFL